MARAALTLYLAAAESLVHQAAVELGRPELIDSLEREIALPRDVEKQQRQDWHVDGALNGHAYVTRREPKVYHAPEMRRNGAGVMPSPLHDACASCPPAREARRRQSRARR